MTAKTPESLTATGRAAQLGIPPVDAKPSQKINVHEMRARVAREALGVPRPATASNDLQQDDEFDGSQMVLPSDEIRAYEHNPRTTENPKYAAIKESIRAQGVTNQLTVTRRPGQKHYVPFSGGNTRLQIVHELQDETAEARWKTMSVTFRKWPGEAAVIAAHLAENEQRGDTSFWEKAQGLASLKDELEKESSKVLTAPELAKEAKRLGMDFGLSTVQNLLFVVDYLQPVGPWLRADMVKTTLKPAITSLAALCDQLGTGWVAFRKVLANCLDLTSDVLRVQAQESSPGEVSLDGEELVRSFNTAIAALLNVPEKQLPLMLSARANNPRLSATELRKVGSSLPTFAGSVSGGSASNSESDAGGAAALEANEQPPATTPARPVSSAPQGQQLPLSPAMLAPVAHSAGTGADEGVVERPMVDPTDPRNAHGTIQSILLDITRIAELGDVVAICESMPLGYYVELPEAGIEAIDGEAPANVKLRKAAWHVLAALSGQFDRRLSPRLPNDSVWKAAAQSSSGFAAQYELLVMGVAHPAPFMAVADVHDFFWHPQLGELFLQLWSWALHWRKAEPQRFFDQLEPVFA
ncbi:MAG: ParB N-terminal domain-containing protein [Burkholderiales bacterium]|nr:ParB N-terminal domain-containing protein [Burkholderiales bacterium]